MMVEALICPICKAGLNEPVKDLNREIIKFDCPNCGSYRLSDIFIQDFIANGVLSEDARAKLSYSFRRMQGLAEFPLVTSQFADEIIRGTQIPTASEKVDNLVLFLGRQLAEPGDRIDLEPDSMRAVLGAKTKDAAMWIMTQALERGLIEGDLKTMRVTQSTAILGATLTIDGWHEFEQLQTTVAGSKRAFMAMKFGDEELDNAFFNCFKPAAKRAGYDLMKLDEEPRAGLIDDRLRLELRTARFVVADLSHGNNGAYWEAGYAEGLGRPVIYTCKQSVFDDPTIRPHFDTNHYLIVPWEPENLQVAINRLATTIRVTLPGEARLIDE